MMLCKGRLPGAPSFFQVALSSKIQNGAGNLDNPKLSLLCQLPMPEGGCIVRIPLRLLAASLIFACALPWIACKKTQPPVQSSVDAAARAVPGVPAAPSASDAHFTREVRRGETFEKSFAPNMIFRLEPDAGEDSGWSIRIAPGSDAAAAAIDCIGPVAEPLHGNKNLVIEPPADGSPKNPSHWGAHEFDFVPDAANCKAAWELMNVVNYPSKVSDKEREEADSKLGRIPRAHGRLTIVDTRLGVATAANEHGVIEWLRFDVDLSLAAATSPAAAQSAGKTETRGAGQGIRGVDLEKFLSTHYGEVNAELDLETACGEGQKPIQSVAPAIYGDLDGDGQEEMAFVAFTCLSGSGGADLFGVLKMMPDGKLAALPIEPMPKVFKGKNTYEALRGHMNLEIKDGRLVETYPIYEGGEANCCPEGGQRRFVYRWDGHQFVHDDMIDVPAAKGEQ